MSAGDQQDREITVTRNRYDGVGDRPCSVRIYWLSGGNSNVFDLSRNEARALASELDRWLEVNP